MKETTDLGVFYYALIQHFHEIITHILGINGCEWTWQSSSTSNDICGKYSEYCFMVCFACIKLGLDLIELKL